MTIYAVEITVDGQAQISRYFQTVKAARRWAKWCAKSYPVRILAGGQGGMVVA